MYVIGNGAKLTVKGGNIRSNTATAVENAGGLGGGVYVNTGASMEMTGGTIGGNNYANTAKNGAGVYLAGTGSITGGTVSHNSASANGGGVYAAGNLTLDGTTTTISNNSAGNENSAGNGGGVYVTGDGAKLTVKGGNIRSNTATAVGDAGGLGGGVYVGNGTSLEMSGGTITANTANNANGGAINVGGENARLIFSGKPVVYNNPNANAGTQQKNVVLSVGDTNIIQSKGITGTYADGTAKIGVYVIDGEGDKRPIYNAHGIYNKPFGNFIADGNLDVFRNDRNGALYGVKNEKDNNDKKIYWLNVVCKLTDSTGKLLYQDQYGHTPAVYSTVRDGFEAAGKTLYNRSGSTYTEGALNLKMLQDYELVKKGDIDEVIEYKTARDITVTTAETKAVSGVTAAWDEYFFKPAEDAEGDSLTKATLKRGEGNTVSMFTVNTASNSFTVKDIILDGNKTTYPAVSANGGIVNVTKGKLVVTDGAVLRNSAVTGNGTDTGLGGAVYVAASGATAEMTGGEITGNSAKDGGAVYVANGGTVTLKDGTKTVSGTATPTSVTIAGNTAATNGAGIYLAEGAKLNMEGSPSFVKGNAVNSLTDTTNYPGDPAKTNGGVEVYADGKVRQDIFLAGYGSTDATSIVVTGAITSGEGSIWVWADQQKHYEMLEQFGTLDDSLLTSDKKAINTTKITQAQLDATYLVFRNAQDDATTGCGGDYLTGQEGDAIKLIKWTGGFDFVFRKLKEDGKPLDGAEFTLYMGVETAKDSGVYMPAEKNSDGKLIPTTSANESTWVAYQQTDKTSTSGGKKDVKSTSGEILDSAPVTIKVKQTDDSTTPPTDKVVDREVSGDGLVVFEKIPPGVYFIKETTPLTVTVEGKTTTYVPVEDMYMIDLNPKGYYTITKVEVGEDTDKNPTYTNKGPAPTETLSFGTDTVDVALAINVDARTRKVILKKVDGTNTPLKDKYFTVKYADKQTVVKVDGVPLEKLKSGVGGAFWIGKLPFGTYYMEEFDSDAATAAITKYFKFKVDENGVSKPEGTDGWTLTNKLDESPTPLP